MDEVSNNAMISLAELGVLSTSWIEQICGYKNISLKKISQENKRKNENN